MDMVRGDTPERPLDPPDNTEPFRCNECGEETKDNHWHCFTHLESTEDLREYAHEKVDIVAKGNETAINQKQIIKGALESITNLTECRDKLVEENRGLTICLEKAHKREEDYARTIKTLIDNANQFLADSLGIAKGVK